MQNQFTDISQSIQSNSFFISDNSHIHKIWFISIGAIDIRTLDIPNICKASYKFTHSKLHTVQILSPSAAYVPLCMSQLDSRNNFNLQNIFCLKSITFRFAEDFWFYSNRNFHWNNFELSALFVYCDSYVTLILIFYSLFLMRSTHLYLRLNQNVMIYYHQIYAFYSSNWFYKNLMHKTCT